MGVRFGRVCAGGIRQVCMLGRDLPPNHPASHLMYSGRMAELMTTTITAANAMKGDTGAKHQSVPGSYSWIWGRHAETVTS